MWTIVSSKLYSIRNKNSANWIVLNFWVIVVIWPGRWLSTTQSFAHFSPFQYICIQNCSIILKFSNALIWFMGSVSHWVFLYFCRAPGITRSGLLGKCSDFFFSPQVALLLTECCYCLLQIEPQTSVIATRIAWLLSHPNESP